MKLNRRLAPLALAVLLTPGLASAQESDTLSISGNYHVDLLYQGEVGADLKEVFVKGNDHGWTLTLHGVTYSHDSYDKKWITRVHATSFDFKFVGPDADILNEIVSAHFTGGMLTGGAFLELWNGDTYYDAYGDFIYSDTYGGWKLGLMPDAGPGVYFDCGGFSFDLGPFRTDEAGYPIVEPQRVFSLYSTIYDTRVGIYGWAESQYDLVDIGSSEPPLPPQPPPPPPPPPAPTLSIADGSVREGNRGTSRLNLTVTLSRSIADTVTVHYATADGTAKKKSDYTATSATLIIPAGQTQGTISVAIKADRKRERDETFSMQLSNAVGSEISDDVATATILNDD
jgi:hypothetical protein